MFRDVTVEELNNYSKNSLIEHLSIQFTEVGSDFIAAKMPVIAKTQQPFGYLHGGASISLAETIGSFASYLSIDPEKFNVFGLSVNANHVRSKRSGFVKAIAKPIHIGSKTHIWDIKVCDEDDKLISTVRLTNIVVEARNE